MIRILSMAYFKTHLPRLLAGVQERAEEVVVTKNGAPAAVLLNFEEYESLKETLEILADPALRRQISRSNKYFTRHGRGLSPEQALP